MIRGAARWVPGLDGYHLVIVLVIMNVVTAHPKYPNDPLALVLIELRHPRTEPPVPSAISILKEELARWTPILEQEEVRQVNLETGEHTAHSQKKLVARDRRTAITFRPDAMTLEVTDYPGWEEFRSIVHAMVTARQDVAPVDGCIRIGLRYINEIRASLAEPSGWAYWVAESLLGPGTQLADLKLTTTAQRHVIQCEGPEPGDSLTLRYAGARGAVIQSTPFLQRLKEPPAEGDFFLIDIDSAWSDPCKGIPALDAHLVDEVAERLHTPIGPLFESLITSELRTKVLQQPGQE
ncbi:TIGR04255 family protein [Mycobacterium tuberculosis]|uniref:TIGR04255 family protein n=1 Tax=Mycobacterium tuberculosis TaxID=1773 RepID=UPI001F26B1BE|nr:TIGR04255 family protein [Mycobacterium tuberculosis]